MVSVFFICNYAFSCNREEKPIYEIKEIIVSSNEANNFRTRVDTLIINNPKSNLYKSNSIVGFKGYWHSNFMHFLTISISHYDNYIAITPSYIDFKSNDNLSSDFGEIEKGIKERLQRNLLIDIIDQDGIEHRIIISDTAKIRIKKVFSIH